MEIIKIIKMKKNKKSIMYKWERDKEIDKAATVYKRWKDNKEN